MQKHSLLIVHATVLLHCQSAGYRYFIHLKCSVCLSFFGKWDVLNEVTEQRIFT